MVGEGIVPVEYAERRILEIRGAKVMIDSDLAELYGVETRILNQAVRRNPDRFPEDFVFRLTEEEKQKVITKCDHLARLRFSPHLPLAFTEHGAIMAANVLSSQHAIEMSVFVVRAFVRLRGVLSATRELAAKLDELERKVGSHDQAIAGLLAAIRKLMTPPDEQDRKPIGFDAREPGA